MQNKKGELSEALKYILVAVAGLAFLGFLIYLAQNLSSIGTNLSSTEVRETLNDYFTTLASSEYIQAPADLKIDAKLIVNNPSCGQFSIQQEDGGSNPAATSHIIYSQKILSGKSLQVWSASWYYPYRVTNFFYLTDVRTKTILIGDQTLVSQLITQIPSSMNVEKGISTNIQDYEYLKKEYDYVHIILIGSGSPQQQDNLLVSIISPEVDTCNKKPDGSERYLCHGTVSYPDGTGVFYGTAMLYGSIFTTSSQDYQCAFTSAQADLQRVSNIYTQKQQLLRQKITGCNRYNLDFNYPDGGNNWASKASSLAEQNKRLGGECEYIF